MNNFTKREQIVILVIVFTIIFGVFFKFVLLDKINEKETQLQILEKEKQLKNLGEDLEVGMEPKDTEEIIEDTIIMIHISGQIYNPGIVELKQGERLKDAVEYAGGLKKDADIDKINLARKLSDEDKIYIPKIGEEILDIEDISIESYQVGNKDNMGKININNCTKEALMSLPGIGEVTAEKIINYRKDNKFSIIEDIKNVSGIGDKKFDAVKDLIVTK